MTDRDTFAMAALTGILARGAWVSSECAAEAYLHADAMLRERGKTNHDAAPAARADGQGRDNPVTPGHGGTGDTLAPHATPPLGSVPGEGSVPDSGKWNEPVAWVAWFDFEDKPDADFLFRNKEQADCWCRKRGADSVPLYLHPAPAVTAEPVAWWLRGPAWWPRGTEYDTGCEYEFVSLVRESADAAAKEGGTVTPLYRAPTLTDEEREALERVCVAYELLPSVGAKQVADTLIKLVERTK